MSNIPEAYILYTSLIIQGVYDDNVGYKFLNT